jgi:hypothetical protein
MKPTIGRIVHYRSNTGHYTMPAIVIATQETIWREGVERGDIADITEPTRVHLECWTAGKNEHYQEFDVPYWEAPTGGFDLNDQPAGTWTWPPRY